MLLLCKIQNTPDLLFLCGGPTAADGAYKFAVHSSATAYRKHVSIARNAKPHARGRFLLKMDFKDFFPSLKATDFRTFLGNQGADFDLDEVSALCNILFWVQKGGIPELCLSIGAPTSPLLSNILMVTFDRDIAELCDALSVKYTRYADDLSVSAAKSEDLQRVEQAVPRWCDTSTSPRLVVNQKKTVRVSKRESRRVTGLSAGGSPMDTDDRDRPADDLDLEDPHGATGIDMGGGGDGTDIKPPR